MSNIRQLVCKDNSGLFNADEVVLCSANGDYGIKNVNTGEMVVEPNTPVTNTGLGTYEYDVSSLPTGSTYEMVWKVTRAGKTNYIPQTFTVETQIVSGDVGYTVQELLERAGRAIGIEFDVEDLDIVNFALDVANEFSDDVAELLPPINSQSYTATANSWYTLPADFMEVDRVEVNGYKYRDYEVREGYPARIQFASDGTYEVWYKRAPYKVTQLSNKSDMHPFIHGTGALLLASRYKSRDDDENADARRLYEDYITARDKRIQRLSNPSGKYKVIEDVLGGYRG